MTLDLTDEERALVNKTVAIAMCKSTPTSTALQFITILLKTQAGKMKAEFYIEHDSCWIDAKGDWVCEGCCDDNAIDPRHIYNDEQWLKAAKEHFSREGKG